MANNNNLDISSNNENKTSSKSSYCPSRNSSCTIGLRGTVLPEVWWKVLLVVLYTTGVCGVNFFIPMDFTPALVPILGTVIGFLLVFRTNTAYDRYYEGRKIWSDMTQAARRLICCIWVSVDSHNGKMIAEKRDIINCVVAFPIAVKHYLREEYSYDYDDLKSLIGHIGAFRNKLNHGSLTQPQKNLRRATRKFSYLHDATHPPKTNIPLEIIHCVGIYIKSLISRHLCDGSVFVSMNLALTCLVDDLGSFERILRTPLPLAYSVHLHHALWIHILSLPFQLVSTLSWWTIPAVGFTSFTLLGILEIGWEIENPFGYDDNDLPLDDFCETLRKEVDCIINNKLRTYDDLFGSEETKPSTNGTSLTVDNIPRSPTTKDFQFSELSVHSLDEVTVIDRKYAKNADFPSINTKF